MPLLFASGAGAASRVSLGTAVFGGMAFATIFGIFVIPWLYFVVQSLSEKFGGAKVSAEPVPVEAGAKS
jgi:Cu/Ag efflux pump CusA